MESNPKEERLFLPQDLIYDIENDSFDSTEEISRIIKRQDEMSQFNPNLQNYIPEHNFNHCQSFQILPYLPLYQNFQFEKNDNSIPYVRSMDDMQKNFYLNNQNLNFNYFNNGFNFKDNQFKDFLNYNKSNLSSLIMSYSGSHFLQKIILHILNEELGLLLEIIFPNLESIMCNSYGNYFLQKIIKKSNKEQRLKIIMGIQKNFIEITKNCSGNHCIQTLIDCINSNEEEKAIKNYIINNLMELSLGSNSNHVIQKLISGMFEKKRDYLLDFVLQNFFILSLNLNGAAVAKKFILEIKDEKIKKFLISQIEKNYFKMCEDQYANYVIQYAIEIFGYSSCKNIINLILNNILIFSVEKYSSNVIDKVIIEINENAPFEFFKLVNFIFTEKNFNIINRSKFGQFVLVNLIKLIPPEFKLVIKNQLINNLQGNSKNVKIINLLG